MGADQDLVICWQDNESPPNQAAAQAELIRLHLKLGHSSTTLHHILDFNTFTFSFVWQSLVSARRVESSFHLTRVSCSVLHWPLLRRMAYRSIST